ncbi:hypothetical protein [Chelatococcus asaccharovorans]|uniref:Uncharacterized protein n=1 Tax=Chelatococcus asaccharovorans TaxID=28210 RepID=A0A2V3U0V2_9HYPH|nr:hypothetical protein [Chelatococcus asaccharovorans]MBS7704291.1 hypothetical protein [Chelatococcus asaccharovorans]PXW55833.1 hypothetical protein C7450_109245 [Chelatococcus asaccharovorans]CAH1664846.1 conserved hypothetical protein [Chelatococcus asaccharovorans]
MPNQGGHDTGKQDQKGMHKDMHPSQGHTSGSGKSASGSHGQQSPQSAPGAGKDKDQSHRK